MKLRVVYLERPAIRVTRHLETEAARRGGQIEYWRPETAPTWAGRPGRGWHTAPMEPPDPNRQDPGFGVPRVFVRWWPLWLVLVVVIIVLMGVIPALVGAGPAIGTVPQSTQTSVTPGS